MLAVRCEPDAGDVAHLSSTFVIPGRPEGPSPESITTSPEYGFRARRCAAPRNDEMIGFEFHQYDFGKPSVFSAMKLRMSSRLTGAMRGISDSRK